MKVLSRIVIFIISYNFLFIYASNTTSILKENLQKFTTFSSDFKQYIYDSNSKIIDQSQGKVLLKKPNSVYWKTILPNEQIIVKNTNKLWIYDVDLEQVTVQSIKTLKQFNVLNLILDDNFNYNDYFKISYANQDKIKKFILIPILDKFDFNKLSIAFINNKLYSLDIYDHFDSKISIRFSNTNYDVSISEQQFSLKITDDIDVIHQE